MQHALAVVFMLVAGALTLSGLQPKIMALLRAPQERAAGVQLNRIATAAALRMTTNFQSLLASTGGGGYDDTAFITQLTTTATPTQGLVGSINAYGQTTVLKVIQPAANTLIGLVLTCGGAAIGDTSALRAADAAAAAAAAAVTQTVLPDPGAIVSYAPSSLTSPQATTTYSLAPFAFGVCQPTAGHLAALVAVDNGQVTPGFLHRYKQGPDDEPATMHTTMFMANNDIRDVRDIQLSSGKWVSNAFSTKGIVQDGAIVAKPSCQTGSTPEIYVDPVIYGDEGIGNPLITVQAYSTSNATPANSWTVRMRVFTQKSDGSGTREVPPGPWAQAKYTVSCE